MITSDMENMGISPLSSNTAADSRYSGDTVYTVDGVCFAMKPIAAVTNGCIGHRHDGDNTPHTVNLTSYRIGGALVTQELWQAVMGSNPILFIIVFVFMFAAYRYHG